MGEAVDEEVSATARDNGPSRKERSSQISNEEERENRGGDDTGEGAEGAKGAEAFEGTSEKGSQLNVLSFRTHHSGEQEYLGRVGYSTQCDDEDSRQQTKDRGEAVGEDETDRARNSDSLERGRTPQNSKAEEREERDGNATREEAGEAEGVEALEGNGEKMSQSNVVSITTYQRGEQAGLGRDDNSTHDDEQALAEDLQPVINGKDLQEGSATTNQVTSVIQVRLRQKEPMETMICTRQWEEDLVTKGAGIRTWEIGEPSNRQKEPYTTDWWQSSDEEGRDNSGNESSEGEESRVSETVQKGTKGKEVLDYDFERNLIDMAELLGVSWQGRRDEMQVLFNKIAERWDTFMEADKGGDGEGIVVVDG